MKLELDLDPPGYDRDTGRPRQYLMFAIDQELCEATAKLIGNGSAESELRSVLERTIGEFLRSRPIDMHLVR